MNVLSLFSGIGGLELGLERAGMTVVGQVEIDPFCRRVLAKHWPEVPRHDDVRTCVDWWRSAPRPSVHVVAGGFPCQPVSLAGKQLAQADERWLWPAFRTVIRGLRPDWVLLENVPGLLGRGMGDVLGDLAAGGYDAEWDCVPAATVGAPHRRDRVFIVAYPERQPVRHEPVTKPRSCGASVAGHDGPDRTMADPARGRGEDQPSGDARKQVGPVDRAGDRTVLRGAAVRGDGSGRGPDVVAAHVADTKGDGRGTRRPGRPAGDGPDGTHLAPPRMADTDSARRLPRSRLGWARPTPLRNGGWPAEPDVDRMAHGVPGRVDRLRALGNAVVPQVAEHIGRLITRRGGDCVNPRLPHVPVVDYTVPPDHNDQHWCLCTLPVAHRIHNLPDLADLAGATAAEVRRQGEREET